LGPSFVCAEAVKDSAEIASEKNSRAKSFRFIVSPWIECSVYMMFFRRKIISAISGLTKLNADYKHEPSLSYVLTHTLPGNRTFSTKNLMPQEITKHREVLAAIESIGAIADLTSQHDGHYDTNSTWK
jgi:hypothetical protein